MTASLDTWCFVDRTEVIEYINETLGGNYNVRGKWEIYNPTEVEKTVGRGLIYRSNKGLDYVLPELENPKEFFRGFFESRLNVRKDGLSLGGINTIAREFVAWINETLKINLKFVEHKGTFIVNIAKFLIPDIYDLFYSEEVVYRYPQVFDSMLKFYQDARICRWEEKHNEQLKACYQEGKTSSEELLLVFKDFSLSTIQNRAGQLGLTKKKLAWTVEELEIIHAAHNKLHINQLVSQLPKRSRATVMAKVRELGVKIKFDRSQDVETEDVRDKILAMSKAGFGVRLMAKELGVSWDTANKWINKLRKELTYEERVEWELLTKKEKDEYIKRFKVKY